MGICFINATLIIKVFIPEIVMPQCLLRSVGLLKLSLSEIAYYRLATKNCKPKADLYNNLGRALYDLDRFKESAEAYGG